MDLEHHLRFSDYAVASCPVCGTPHAYSLRITYTVELLFFGGKAGERHTVTLQSEPWNVKFCCPQSGESFSFMVSLARGKSEHIIDVVAEVTTIAAPSVDSLSQVERGPDSQSPGSELQEWMRSSRSISRDFCKTMLTIDMAAIPVDFAIEKYLGMDAFTHTWIAWASLLPLLMFLLSAAIFVMALRPQLLSVASIYEFLQLRTRLTLESNRLLWVGTALLGSGVLCSIMVFAFVIFQ